MATSMVAAIHVHDFHHLCRSRAGSRSCETKNMAASIDAAMVTMMKISGDKWRNRVTERTSS
jgi:hypothetical protein